LFRSDAIAAARNPELARLLYALGIPEVGAAVARTLARHFGSFAAVRTATTDELIAVDGIGDVMAEQIHSYFHDPSNAAALDELLDGRLTPRTEERTPTAAAGSDLAGQTFVFTGSMQSLGRDQAEELVRSLGAKASGSVSSKTTRLVAGEGGGSKLTKAQDLGITILSEGEFLALLADHGISVATETDGGRVDGT